MSQVNVASKSQLAKLLAVENITVQHQAGAKTAWFDVKNRVLTLPVWREMSNDLYDMLVVHEVGHALDTPADTWIDAIEKIAAKINPDKPKSAMPRIKGFLNVIEDARIDKRQKRRFPGSKRNYLAGYKDLIERDFFGTSRRDVNSMSFIDRMNIYFKGGVALGIKFSAEEMPMLKAVENAETFAEVIELTEKIYLWSKNKKDQQQEIPDDHRMSDDGDGDDEYDFEDFDTEASDDTSDETDGSGKGNQSSQDDFGDESDEDGDNDSGDNEDGTNEASNEAGDGAVNKNKGAGETDDDDLPESETEKAWNQKQDELIADADTAYHYVTYPTFDLSKIVDDYPKVLTDMRGSYASNKSYNPNRFENMIKEFVDYKTKESATISFMVKEFEMRKSADEYSRTSIAKTGVIDTNKLHSYKYNDDIFRRIATVTTGKNHGFVIVMDWSGSMLDHLKSTVKQLLSLAMFCKRVQIPFEVYTFRTPNENEFHVSPITYKHLDIMVSPFKLRNVLSSRMKTHELNEAMLHLWYAACGVFSHTDYLNSTPLNQTIMALPDVVNMFKARTKVQIVNMVVLTDGQSDPSDSVYGEGRLPITNVKKTKYIIQDAVTKKTYELPMNPRWSGFGGVSTDAKTNTYLKILKDRTGCNLIGFYIFGKNFKYAFQQFNGYTYSQEFFDENKKSWSDDGFIVSRNSGYDEYYILNTDKLKITNGQLEINNDMTKGKIAKEFMKFSGNKSVNRVLLQRFVKRIAA